jgi:hypothetical protein
VGDGPALALALGVGLGRDEGFAVAFTVGRGVISGGNVTRGDALVVGAGVGVAKKSRDDWSDGSDVSTADGLSDPGMIADGRGVAAGPEERPPANTVATNSASPTPRAVSDRFRRWRAGPRAALS